MIPPMDSPMSGAMFLFMVFAMTFLTVDAHRCAEAYIASIGLRIYKAMMTLGRSLYFRQSVRHAAVRECLNAEVLIARYEKIWREKYDSLYIDNETRLLKRNKRLADILAEKYGLDVSKGMRAGEYRAMDFSAFAVAGDNRALNTIRIDAMDLRGSYENLSRAARQISTALRAVTQDSAERSPPRTALQALEEMRVLEEARRRAAETSIPDYSMGSGLGVDIQQHYVDTLNREMYRGINEDLARELLGDVTMTAENMTAEDNAEDAAADAAAEDTTFGIAALPDVDSSTPVPAATAMRYMETGLDWLGSVAVPDNMTPGMGVLLREGVRMYSSENVYANRFSHEYHNGMNPEVCRNIQHTYVLRVGDEGDDHVIECRRLWAYTSVSPRPLGERTALPGGRIPTLRPTEVLWYDSRYNLFVIGESPGSIAHVFPEAEWVIFGVFDYDISAISQAGPQKTNVLVIDPDYKIVRHTTRRLRDNGGLLLQTPQEDQNLHVIGGRHVIFEDERVPPRTPVAGEYWPAQLWDGYNVDREITVQCIIVTGTGYPLMQHIDGYIYRWYGGVLQYRKDHGNPETVYGPEENNGLYSALTGESVAMESAQEIWDGMFDALSSHCMTRNGGRVLMRDVQVDYSLYDRMYVLWHSAWSTSIRVAPENMYAYIVGLDTHYLYFSDSSLQAGDVLNGSDSLQSLLAYMNAVNKPYTYDQLTERLHSIQMVREYYAISYQPDVLAIRAGYVRGAEVAEYTLQDRNCLNFPFETVRVSGLESTSSNRLMVERAAEDYANRAAQFMLERLRQEHPYHRVLQDIYASQSGTPQAVGASSNSNMGAVNVRVSPVTRVKAGRRSLRIDRKDG